MSPVTRPERPGTGSRVVKLFYASLCGLKREILSPDDYFGNERLSLPLDAYRNDSFDTPQRRLLQLGGNNVRISAECFYCFA
jgi:hypothetical protein